MSNTQQDLNRICNTVFCTTGHKIDNRVIAIVLAETEKLKERDRG